MTEQPTTVIDVTDETFEADVLERSHQLPIVVDFWAEWCGPCRVLGPTLEKLADEGKGKFLLAKVDTDRAQRVSQILGIKSIPTVIAFRGGKPVAQFSGALPEEAVREFLERLMPSPSDEIVEEADKLRASAPMQAEPLYRRALEMDDGHAGAGIGLAELMAERGERDEARAMVEGLLPATGAHGERIEQLHALLALSDGASEASEEELRERLAANPKDTSAMMDLGQVFAANRRYPEALQMFFQAAESDREVAKGAAKERMVELFHVVGVRSELADDYRTKLRRLLY
jgi:putative thioredoxin